jgi:hypothetical protein
MQQSFGEIRFLLSHMPPTPAPVSAGMLTKEI